MKKLFIVVSIVAASFFVAKPSFAGSAPNVDTLFSSGTASKLIVAGPGTLFSMHITSGTAGDYVVCYDTGSATGITTTLGGTAAVPELMRVFVSTANGVPGAGFVQPSIPVVNFTNGLGCIQSAVQRTNIYYRQPN